MELTLTFQILNIIGTVAFAVSGALVAMEEDFDILGVYVLGFSAAFGGGLIRNLMIGLPVESIWGQNQLFLIAAVIISIIFFFPNIWNDLVKKSIVLFDAIGLAAFAIQGANYAVSQGSPVVAVMIAATLTGTGGGMIRDILAGRRPMILHSEIYAVWAALVGLVVYFLDPKSPWLVYFLIVIVVILRMFSVIFNWNLPRSKAKWLDSDSSESNNDSFKNLS